MPNGFWVFASINFFIPIMVGFKWSVQKGRRLLKTIVMLTQEASVF